MSTFTDSNCPQGSNIRASDLIRFADAYSEMKADLDEHVIAKAEANVHGVKSYIEDALKSYALTTDVNRELAAKADKSELGEYATKDALAAKADKSELGEYATKDALAAKVDKSELSEYVTNDTLKDYAKSSELGEYAKSSELGKYTLKEDTDSKITDALKGGREAEFRKVTTDLVEDTYVEGERHNVLIKSTKIDARNRVLELGDERIHHIDTPNRMFLHNDTGASPYLTAADISALDRVGMIAMWPFFVTGTGVAKNVPDGYHACDGTPFTAEEYPALAALYQEAGESLVFPVIDYAIIKVKDTVKIVSTSGIQGNTLADAVATIHNTYVYESTGDLPDTADDGKEAIVRINGSYYVYIYHTGSGWSLK